MKRTATALTLGILCVLLVAGMAVAEGVLDLSWFRIGGGGREVEAGGLSLDGCIGQGAAETVRGGGLELQSGFTAGAAGRDHSLSVDEVRILVEKGDTALYDLVLYSRPGLTTEFSFELTGLPAGASASYDPETISGSGTSRLSIQTTAQTPAGKYILTLTATGAGAADMTKQIVLVVANEIRTQDVPLLFQR